MSTDKSVCDPFIRSGRVRGLEGLVVKDEC